MTSQNVINPRRLVGIQAERVTNVSSTDYPGHYPDEDHSWNLEKFKKVRRNIMIHGYSCPLTLVFARAESESPDTTTVTAVRGIWSGWRRCLYRERIPEDYDRGGLVFVRLIFDSLWCGAGANSLHRTRVCVEQYKCGGGWGSLTSDRSRAIERRPSIGHDERECVTFCTTVICHECCFIGVTEQATDRNTIVFGIKILCERNPNAPKGSTNPSELYINHELLSSHMEWKPAGEQEDVFAGKPPAPTNPNIVLTKLRPGQGVEMELHAVKGVGKDHAKFSPVGPIILEHSWGISSRIIIHSDCLLPPSSKHNHHETDSPTICREIPKVFLPWCHPYRPQNKSCQRW